MSDKGRPIDPFGRNERTIVRPNPGGRRAGAPMPSPPPQAPGTDDWVSGPLPPAVKPAPVQAVVLRRRELDAPNQNPLMQSAAPLLLLLGRLRANLVRAHPAQLMEQVADAVQSFEEEARGAGFPAEQVRMAKYALCATADDIVQNMPVEDRHIWTQYSMLSRFFGERIGGLRFYEELDRAKMDPVVNYPVLELMHACLALGFEGVHRTSAGGVAMLQQVQRSLYDTLRRVRPRASPEISPRWQGQSIAARTSRFRVPFWAVASVVAVLLFGFYFLLRIWLSSPADDIETALLALSPAGPIEVVRVAPAPPPKPPVLPKQHEETQYERICNRLLKPEIQAGKLTCEETANEVIIRVANQSLFASGSADVLKSFQPIALSIARTLEKEPGDIKIVGHTDNTRLKKRSSFASNYDLSVERAQAVAELMRPQLSHPERVRTEGKGADQPIVPNTTEANKAINRRVEIMIPRQN